jgi:hypothetical protein
VPIDLPSLERLAVQEALRREGGNRTHAARLLGISLRTLRNKLREYRTGAGLRRSAAASADGQLLPVAADASGPIAAPGAASFEDVSAPAPSARPSHPVTRHKEQAA